MNTVDLTYATLIKTILEEGDEIRTRNSNVRRIIGEKVVFNHAPLISVRKTAWKNALREWEWFMSGQSDIRSLHPSVHSWWLPWADENQVVKNNYSEQFRCFVGGIHNHETDSIEMITLDQIEALIDGIKNHPSSRRNVITTWNTAEMFHTQTPITNCHGTVIQAFVDPQNRLHLTTYQRSVDVICGLPHNWIQYWAFLLWLAERGGREVGSLIWIGGDVHVYEAHEILAKKIVMEAANVMKTPSLIYDPTSDDFKAEDFKLDCDYSPIITDKAEMIV